MEYNENIAGLGKNHNKEAHDHDLAKKQSEAKPAAENLDTTPHSIDKSEIKDRKNGVQEIHEQAHRYAKEEHEKAENWENTDAKKKADQ